MFPPADKEAMLTAREKEVLQLVSKGLISKQIADKLFISVNTVNTHRQRILEKLQADSTIEAIKYASGLGII
jgi:DNA-binding CsgD family transcriptional regulator